MTSEPTIPIAYERLGRYEILGEIASGGMATVYLGRVTGAKGFQRLVAIKRLHPHLESEEDFVSMFLDEARLAARIRHPNCVATLDVEDQEGLYIVMEYIEGDRLLGLLRHANKSGERIPPAVALRIALDTLAGLHAAHELCDDDGQLFGLVHRDVSPQNILIGVDGVARLTDFGIAKATARLTVTRDGQLKGKIAYMAPEQTKKVEIDRRVDVFAMGIITWEMLTSKKLFTGDSDVEVLNQLLFEPIPRLRDSAPGIPASLDAAVMRALERDPNKRFATALEFSEALEAASKAFGGPANARLVAAHLQKTSGEKLAKEKVRFAAGAHAQSEQNTPSSSGTSRVQKRPATKATLTGTGPSLGLEPEHETILSAGPPRDALKQPPSKKTLLGAGGMLPPSALNSPRSTLGGNAPPSFNPAVSNGVGIVPDLDDEEEIPTSAFAKERREEEPAHDVQSLDEPSNPALMMPASVPPVPMSTAVPGLPVLPKVPAPSSALNVPAVPAPPVPLSSLGANSTAPHLLSPTARPGVKTEVLSALSSSHATDVLSPSAPSATGLAAVTTATPDTRTNSRAGLMVGVGGALLAAGGIAAVLLLRTPAVTPQPQVRVVDRVQAASQGVASAAPAATAASLAPIEASATAMVPVEATASALPTAAPVPEGLASAGPSATPIAATAATAAPMPSVSAAPTAVASAAPALAAASANGRGPRTANANAANNSAGRERPTAQNNAANNASNGSANSAPSAAPTPTAAPRPTAASHSNDPFGEENPYN